MSADTRYPHGSHFCLVMWWLLDTVPKPVRAMHVCLGLDRPHMRWEGKSESLYFVSFQVNSLPAWGEMGIRGPSVWGGAAHAGRCLCLLEPLPSQCPGAMAGASWSVVTGPAVRVALLDVPQL